MKLLQLTHLFLIGFSIVGIPRAHAQEINIPALLKKPNLSQKERSDICGEIYQKYEKLPLLKNYVFRLKPSDLPSWNSERGWSLNTILALGCIKNQDPETEALLIQNTDLRFGENANQALWALSRAKTTNKEFLNRVMVELRSYKGKNTDNCIFCETWKTQLRGRIVELMAVIGGARVQDDVVLDDLLTFFNADSAQGVTQAVVETFAAINPTTLSGQVKTLNLLKSHYYQIQGQAARVILSLKPVSGFYEALAEYLVYETTEIPAYSFGERNVDYYNYGIREYALKAVSLMYPRNDVIADAVVENLKLSESGRSKYSSSHEALHAIFACGDRRATTITYLLQLLKSKVDEAKGSNTILEILRTFENLKIKSEKLDIEVDRILRDENKTSNFYSDFKKRERKYEIKGELNL